MRRILISIFCTFMIFSAFGAGENIPTSKSYVDVEIATKQDKIAANNGAAQVLTNTGTAGEYGTKNIYDSTGSYAAQSDALIDAVTMNTAVQNAIDSEFQCVEYNPNDPNDCWLMQIYNQDVNISITDNNLVEQGSIASANGDNLGWGHYQTNRIRLKDYINIQPNMHYTIASNLPVVSLFYYDAEKNYLGTSSWHTTPYTFKTLPGMKLLRIVFVFSSGTNAPISINDFEYFTLSEIFIPQN